MTYATEDDVKNRLRNIVISATSEGVNSASVVKFLEEAEATINSCLQSRYEIPITGVESLKIVRKIEADIVASLVASIIDLKQATNQPAHLKQEFNRKDFQVKANDELILYQRGEKILFDAVEKTSGVVSGLVGIVPFFDRSAQQW